LLGALVASSSLYRSAASLRGLALGQFQWIMALRVGYLLALALFGLTPAVVASDESLFPRAA
jgi:hypothetical protein